MVVVVKYHVCASVHVLSVFALDQAHGDTFH